MAQWMGNAPQSNCKAFDCGIIGAIKFTSQNLSSNVKPRFPIRRKPVGLSFQPLKDLVLVLAENVGEVMGHMVAGNDGQLVPASYKQQSKQGGFPEKFG